MELTKPSPVRRWLQRITVGALSGALVFSSASFAGADEPTPAPTPSPVATATATPTSSPTPTEPPVSHGTVTAKATSKAYKGKVLYVTGKLGGFTGSVKVRAQVKIGDTWTTKSSLTTTGTSYKLRLKYHESTTGPQSWRVLATSEANGTTVSSTVKLTRVANPTVTAKTSLRYRTVGYDVKLTGSLKGFLSGTKTIESQVRVNGAWKTLSKTTTSKSTYSIKANYKTKTLATQKFRVRVTHDVVRVGSNSVKVTRVPKNSISINGDRIKRLGADTYATGTVKGIKGRGKIYTQAYVNGRWATKSERAMTFAYNGTKYSRLLNYKTQSTGAVKWRIVAKAGGERVVSKTVKVTRTLKGIDSRCVNGRVLCISKKDRKLRWMIDGKVITTLDARFGRASEPTRNGSFTVFRKSRNHVSSLYGSAMPYAMFFSGGQAIHYSSDFAARGYNGASHGCVNIRDRARLAALFDKVRLGDKVVVYG